MHRDTVANVIVTGVVALNASAFFAAGGPGGLLVFVAATAYYSLRNLGNGSGTKTENEDNR